MREMRLYKREIRDPEIIREILEECSVVRLGTRDEEGMFIVPVNFGYEFYEKESGQALTLFIHGAGEGRKADAFDSCPDVAVEMDCRHGIITGDYTCSYSYSYRSIMGNGKVRRKRYMGSQRSWSIWLPVRRLSSVRLCWSAQKFFASRWENSLQRNGKQSRNRINKKR